MNKISFPATPNPCCSDNRAAQTTQNVFRSGTYTRAYSGVVDRPQDPSAWWAVPRSVNVQSFVATYNRDDTSLVRNGAGCRLLYVRTLGACKLQLLSQITSVSPPPAQCVQSQWPGSAHYIYIYIYVMGAPGPLRLHTLRRWRTD